MNKFPLALAFLASLAVTSAPTLASAQRNLPPAALPGITQQAQAAQSYEVIELQEKVRDLNGKVEELNFLLLQLQEKLRQMEEENEGRFQEIEEKLSQRGDASDGNEETTDTARVDDNSDTAKTEPGDGENRLEKPETSGAPAATDVKPSQSDEETRTATTGAPPRALGTLLFDKDGNVIDGDTGSQPQSINPFGNASEGSVEASEFGTTPDEVFEVGKKAFDDRQYPRAEQVFSAHIKAWPKDNRTGAARYYMAESLFWQREYYRAAEAHLDTHNDYPEAETAADNLLGLGLALAGLNQREVACATYAEVLKQYPDSKSRLGERIKDEQAAARC